MIPARYLAGVATEPFEGCPGVFATEHYKRQGSYRYVSSYADGKTYKGKIFALLAKHGQPEARGQWDLHHVVEGQHFADIDFAGRMRIAYQSELPVVLIHKNEHVAYNMLLHIAATDEMFRDGLPEDLLQRSAAAAASAAQPAERPELNARLDRLVQLYDAAYMGDSVLQRIARNVFDGARALLR